MTMKRMHALAAVAAIGLLLAGCGEDPQVAPESGAEETVQQEENGAGSTGEESGEQSFGAITLLVPEGWTPIEVTGEIEPGDWAAGFMDDEEDPTAFLRVMPESTAPPHADAAANELIAAGQFTDIYGDSFEVTGREPVELDGAEEAYEVRFRYLEGSTEIQGRWWVAADRRSGLVSAVEYAGKDVTDEQFDAFAESIEFDPRQAS